MENKKWVYDVKCRKCGKIERLSHSRHLQLSVNQFRSWAVEHSTFPISMGCDCDNEMMMFHDIVSYGEMSDV